MKAKIVSRDEADNANLYFPKDGGLVVLTNGSNELDKGLGHATWGIAPTKRLENAWQDPYDHLKGGIITGLVVREDLRGNGYGKQLIVKTLKDIKNNGHEYASAVVDADDVATNRILEINGFVSKHYFPVTNMYCLERKL